MSEQAQRHTTEPVSGVENLPLGTITPVWLVTNYDKGDPLKKYGCVQSIHTEEPTQLRQRLGTSFAFYTERRAVVTAEGLRLLDADMPEPLHITSLEGR